MMRLPCAAVLLLLLGVVLAAAQDPVDSDMTARIRSEGLQRSQALALYRTLTDELGARLTGSPARSARAWSGYTVGTRSPTRERSTPIKPIQDTSLYGLVHLHVWKN